MDYIKKICLIKECCAGFSCTGEKLNGMVKCEQTNASVKIELSVDNLAPLENDKYLLFIGNSNKNCVFYIEGGFCNIITYVDLLDISSDFAVLILLENQKKPIAFGKTLLYPYSVTEFLELYKQKDLTLFLEEQNIENLIEENFNYSDDVVATENYYEFGDVDLKNLSLKEEDENAKNEIATGQNLLQEKEQENKVDTRENESTFNPSEKINCETSTPTQTTQSDCPSLTEFADLLQEDDSLNNFSICEDVENILNSYPRFAELENAIYNSKWVSISLEGCEYYFGKASISADSYLCYAVKGEINSCPTELKDLATFIPSPYSKTQGYYVMFQKEN